MPFAALGGILKGAKAAVSGLFGKKKNRQARETIAPAAIANQPQQPPRSIITIGGPSQPNQQPMQGGGGNQMFLILAAVAALFLLKK